MRTAVEIKASARVHEGDLGGLKALGVDERVRSQIVVCLEAVPRRIGKIEIVPWRTFVERLYAGEFT